MPGLELQGPRRRSQHDAPQSPHPLHETPHRARRPLPRCPEYPEMRTRWHERLRGGALRCDWEVWTRYLGGGRSEPRVGIHGLE